MNYEFSLVGLAGLPQVRVGEETRRVEAGDLRVGCFVASDPDAYDGSFPKEQAMATSDKLAQATLVSCEVCLKEVPVAEATIAEATDYFVHFCGLDCYEKWKSQREVPTQQVERKSGS